MTYQETIHPARWVRHLDGYLNNTGAPSGATDGIAVPNNWKGKHVIVRNKWDAQPGSWTLFYWNIWGYCPGELDSNGEIISGSGGWTMLECCGDTTRFFWAFAPTDGDRCFVYTCPSMFTRLFFQTYGAVYTDILFYTSFGFTE